MSIQIPSDMIPVGPYKLLRAEHIIGASAWPWNYATVAAVRAGATAIEQPHVEVGASRYQWVAASSAVDDGTEATDAILPTGQAPEVTGRWLRIADASDIPDATDSTGGLLTDALAAKLAGIQAGALASAAVTYIANARASAAVGAIPSATTLVNGLATTTQITKLDGIPTDAQSALQVSAIATNVATGLFSTELVLSWYLANWAVTDWYLDSVAGNDDNAGTSAGTALATAEELSRRLAIALPIAHPVTVHVAQGTYGTLAVSVIQTAVACPFDVVGTPVLTSIGMVTTYTDINTGTNTAPLAVFSAVSDTASLVGKRIDIGAAVAWGEKTNPHALGAATLRTTRFSTQGTASFTPVNSVPTSGLSASSATLPTIEAVIIRQSGVIPDATTNYVARRAVRVADLNIDTLDVISSGRCVVDACSVGYLQTISKTAYTRVQLNRSHLRGFGAGVTLDFVTLHTCLVYFNSVSALTIGPFTALSNCLFRSTSINASPSLSGAITSCGFFDLTTNAISMSKFTAIGTLLVAGCYGRDITKALVALPNCGKLLASAANTGVGTLGAVYLEGQNAYLPWSALPYVDGERSGEATLTAGTVDVTVPYVLSTQKMQVSVKTLAGTPGFLSVVYLTATTIRITSSSATDTSVVTWHILPVGDNVVIRS
jgi:hypothetical protein